MKPIIVLTTRYLSEQTILLNAAYTTAIIEAGGLPILVPIGVDSDIEQVLSLADGVLLTGGVDVDPAYFGEAQHPKLGEVVPGRDALEIALVKATMSKGMPLFGICRGHQVLNVALGGSLYQDIDSQIDREDLLLHAQKEARVEATHFVDIVPDSQLARIVESDRIAVNSFHHQSVKDVAPVLQVIAQSSDDVIEALVHEDLPFCLSVQWHPEEQACAGDIIARKLFKGFVDACEGYKSIAARS